MTRRSIAALLGALLVSLTAGCSLDPTRLPVPGSYVPGDKYTIKVEFSSVLNLPARAKVDFGGVRVGVLDRVQLVGSTAVAYVDVSGSVKLPQNTRAELRQATVLGDIYIALLPPDNPAATPLHDGDTIPLRNTAPADNVEDILRGVSNLVSGGSLNTLQDAVINFNKAFPKDPAEQDRIRRKLATVLHDLAANQDTIDEILSSTENIGRSLIANTGVFDRLITEGPGKLEAMAGVLPDIIELVVDFQDLGRSGGQLLAPNAPDVIEMLSYITPLVGSVATADTTVPLIADKVVGLIRDKLIPFFGNGGPKFSVSVDPGARADQTISAMRTMGMLP
ncbi:Lipoprotein LprN [Mycobacterium simulans]|uniref:MlaD family protein n=1 Tax=Mycobacterium simulans TaxID=627089 RepID=UPI00174C2236|nr:MlaD family protein [Mycobacterium simulans]SON60246.1 Lipoprotein LprN [Mycobacterium simulans]